MSSIERGLSIAAVIPVIGTIPAAIKITIGATQAIVALALAIITAIPAIFNESARSFNQRACTHIIHGGGNILAGVLEAIPIVGTIIVFQRGSMTTDCKGFPCYIEAEKEEGRFVEAELPNGQDGTHTYKLEYYDAQPHRFLAYAKLLPKGRVIITNMKDRDNCSECKKYIYNFTHRGQKQHQDQEHFMSPHSHKEVISRTTALTRGINFFESQTTYWLAV